MIECLNFYCKIVAHCGKYGIDEWNERSKLVNELSIPHDEIPYFLGEVPCEKQCSDCVCIVGERRMHTKMLIKKSKDGCEALKEKENE